MSTRPDVAERRQRERVARTEAQRKVNGARQAMLLEAAALEGRAASLTRNIAVLDEERTRLLVRAVAMRMEAAK